MNKPNFTNLANKVLGAALSGAQFSPNTDARLAAVFSEVFRAGVKEGIVRCAYREDGVWLVGKGQLMDDVMAVATQEIGIEEEDERTLEARRRGRRPGPAK